MDEHEQRRQLLLAASIAQGRIEALLFRIRVMRLFFTDEQLELTWPNGPDKPPVFKVNT